MAVLGSQIMWRGYFLLCLTVSHHRRPFLTQEKPWKIEPRLLIFAFQNFIYIYISQQCATGGSWSITTTVVKICHRHSPTYDPLHFSPLFIFWRVVLMCFFSLFICFSFSCVFLLLSFFLLFLLSFLSFSQVKVWGSCLPLFFLFSLPFLFFPRFFLLYNPTPPFPYFLYINIFFKKVMYFYISSFFSL